MFKPLVPRKIEKNKDDIKIPEGGQKTLFLKLNQNFKRIFRKIGQKEIEFGLVCVQGHKTKTPHIKNRAIQCMIIKWTLLDTLIAENFAQIPQTKTIEKKKINKK